MGGPRRTEFPAFAGNDAFVWLASGGFRFGPRSSSYGGHVAPPASISLARNPVLEHLQRHGTVVVGSHGKGAVVAFLDPGLVGTGVLARKREPHQAARGLLRQAGAVEQHLPAQRPG